VDVEVLAGHAAGEQPLGAGVGGAACVPAVLEVAAEEGCDRLGQVDPVVVGQQQPAGPLTSTWSRVTVTIRLSDCPKSRTKVAISDGGLIPGLIKAALERGLRETSSVILLIVSADRSVPSVDTRWCRMSRIVIPPAYKLTIISSRPPSRREPFGTSRGVNVPSRSRETSGPTSPTCEASVFGLLPLREFANSDASGSPLS
jgi:hypothetical protein